MAVLRPLLECAPKERESALYVRKGALPLVPFTVGRLGGLRNGVSQAGIPERRVSLVLKGLPGLVARIDRVADGIIAVTDAVKEDIEDTYDGNLGKGAVIHNGANTDLFDRLTRYDADFAWTKPLGVIWLRL